VWKTLKTAHLSIAQARLAEMLKEHRGRKGKEVDSANAKMTFADAAELDQRQLDAELTLKRRTRKYYREVLAALLKSWPGLASMDLRRISVSPREGQLLRSAARIFAPIFPRPALDDHILVNVLHVGKGGLIKGHFGVRTGPCVSLFFPGVLSRCPQGGPGRRSSVRS